jgi:hypothetical protein
MRFVIAASVLLSTTIASAQAPGTVAIAPLDAEPVPGLDVVPLPSETVSYRAQVHLADGASVLAVIGGGMSGNGEIAAMGFAGYFVGAPLVHLANGQPARAAKSLGLRVALPMLGALAGFKLMGEDTASDSAHSCTGDPASACVGMGGSLVGLMLGGMLGAVTASYIDGKYLASYERPRAWSPNIAPMRGGVSLGLSGSF